MALPPGPKNHDYDQVTVANSAVHRACVRAAEDAINESERAKLRSAD